MLVLARVVGDAKQTLPDISIISIYYLWRNFRILEEKKRTTTHERAESLQHVLSLSLVVVVFFIVPDLHVQRPGAVLREIRVVFMDETKIVTQMENKTRTPAEETERRRTRESRRVLLARGG